MVQGIGPTGSGSGGSIKDLSAYQTYYPMYEAYCQSVDDNLSFEAWLIMKGYIKNFNQQVENYIETGNEKRGDESKNTIDSNHHVSNGTGALYQSVDDDTYYEFDWESGTYKVITDKEDIADALGMPSGHNIDMINLGYMNAEITDITFGNLDDGQNSTTRDLYGNYANVSYTQQEFDIHYILDALLMNPNDPQYQIAKEVFDELCANTSQWLPDSDLEELNQIAEEFGVNSAEYKTRLQEILLANLDQAQEWVDDHAHVMKARSVLLQTAHRQPEQKERRVQQTERKALQVPMCLLLITKVPYWMPVVFWVNIITEHMSAVHIILKIMVKKTTVGIILRIHKMQREQKQEHTEHKFLIQYHHNLLHL